MSSNVVIVLWGWMGRCTAPQLLRQSGEDRVPREESWSIVVKPSWANGRATKAEKHAT